MTDAYKTGFEEHYFDAPDGLKLYAREYRPATSNDKTPFVCLPGLTRNSGDFHQFALNVANHPTHARRVFTFDLRGRGKSAWDDNKANYNPAIEAQDVIAGCAAIDIKHGIFIGTSRGGLVMHVIMAMAPQLISAAVFNDVGPTIGLEGLKIIQQYLSGPPVAITSWEQAAQGAKMVHGAFFPAFQDQDWMDMAHATLEETPDGLKAPVDPAILAATAGLDLSQPLPELWDQFSLFQPIPLMTIRGETSVLLTPEILQDMQTRNPDMKTVIATGQGHAPFLHLGGLDEKILAFAEGI